MARRWLVLLCLLWLPVALHGWPLHGVLADETASVPAFRGNNGRTGEMPGSLPSQPYLIDEKWRFKTGGSVYSTPVVQSGIVYFGSEDGAVYAVMLDTGILIWVFQTGDSIFAPPTIAGTLLLVPSEDETLYALDLLTGSEIWRFQGDGPLYTAAAVENDLVVVNGGDERLYSLDLATGVERWWYDGISLSLATPAIADGMVVVPVLGEAIAAIDLATGLERWTTPVGAEVWTEAVIRDGTVFVVAADDRGYYSSGLDSRLVALSAADGSKLWEREVRDAYASPAVADGVVYLANTNGGNDGWIEALDAASGIELWQSEALGEIRAAPAISGEQLVVLLHIRQGVVVYIDRSNGEVSVGWLIESRGVVAGPVVVGSIVLVGATDGSLSAYAPVTRYTLVETPLLGAAVDSGVVRATLPIGTEVYLAGEEVTSGAKTWVPVLVPSLNMPGWVDAAALT